VRPCDQAPDDQVNVIARNGWLIREGQNDTPPRKSTVAATVEDPGCIRRPRNHIAFAKDARADLVDQQIVEDFTVDCAQSRVPDNISTYSQ
jgi:hypothetical protein